MAAQEDKKKKIVLAALDLAAQKGWDKVTLADIAGAAELSLPALHDFLDDKADILVLLGRMIDRRVLENTLGQGAEQDKRARLFDLLMERFEILNEYRAGVQAVFESFKSDPKEAVLSLPHLGRSMSWMLEAAGISTAGPAGVLKVAGLSGVYLNVLRVWREDESPDLARTMAALDKNLARAESWVERFGF